MTHQRLLAGRANAGHLVKLRAQALLATDLAVVGDRETVGLVADALHKIERLGVARQQDRNGLLLLEDLLPLLGQPNNRDLGELQAVHHLDGRRELTLAAIDDDEIWEDAPGPGRAAALDLAVSIAGAVGV